MSNLALRSVIAGVMLCALACGGGSGPSDVTVHLDTQAVQLTGPEGSSQQQRLVVTTTGGSAPVHVRATADGTGVDRVDISSSGADTLLDVRSSAALPAGVYRGTLTVLVCSDAACQHPVGGTPVHVPYTVTVTRPLRVTPGAVQLASVSGSGADAAVAVTLPTGAAGFDVDVTAGAGWLTISDRTAVGFLVHAGVRPPGSYLGSLRVTAGGAAVVVEVQYAVSRRPLVVTPTRVSLAAVSGAGADAAMSVSLPDGAADFTVDPGDVGWLGVVEKTAQGCTLRARSLPAGSYHATAAFAAGGLQTFVPVDYVVAAPPGGEHGIRSSPASLTFTVSEGAASAAQRLSVTPPTWGPALQARVEYAGSSGWLSVTPAPGGYDVQADAGALGHGGYVATVVVSGDADTTDVRVPVALTVGAGLVRPPDREIEVTAASVPADLQGSAVIAMAGGPQRSWTASSDAAWLVLDGSAGLTGEALTYHVVLAHVAAMESGDAEVATVTVTPSPATITPTSFRIQLTKALAQVTGVTPGVQPAGRVNRVLVRGKGFGLTASGVQLAVDGVGTFTATWRSDDELELLVPAAPAGAYPVHVASGLDLPGSSAVLRLYEPVTFAYARLDQAGDKHGLVYDPARQRLYLANAGRDLLLRYAYGGGTWTATQRSVAALAGVALSPDGRFLVATTRTGALLLLDPDTLADVAAYDRGQGFLVGSLYQGPPVTNDGRVWLTFVEWGGFTALGYFDLNGRAFSLAPLGTADPFFYTDGPSLACSRDGERLAMTQSPSSSSERTMLYQDAVDGLLLRSPLQQWYTLAAFDDDAGRLMLDGWHVYDRHFALVGDASLPGGYFAVGAALSSDGTRAYVLGYGPGFEDPLPPPPYLFVFDTSDLPATGPAFPLLGSVELPDFPSCRDHSACNVRSQVTAAPDGQTLLIAGSEAVLVVPIPAPLRPPP